MTPDGPHEWRPSRLKPSEIGCHLGRVVLLGKDVEDTQGSGARREVGRQTMGSMEKFQSTASGSGPFQSTN